MRAGVRFVTSRHFCAFAPFRAMIPKKPDFLVIYGHRNGSCANKHPTQLIGLQPIESSVVSATSMLD